MGHKYEKVFCRRRELRLFSPPSCMNRWGKRMTGYTSIKSAWRWDSWRHTMRPILTWNVSDGGAINMTKRLRQPGFSHSTTLLIKWISNKIWNWNFVLVDTLLIIPLSPILAYYCSACQFWLAYPLNGYVREVSYPVRRLHVGSQHDLPR